MRTKLNFKIDAFKVEVNGKQIETPEVNIATEIETTIGELKDLYELKKIMLKESPELIEEFMTKFASLHKTCIKISKNEFRSEEDVMQELEREEHEQIENESLDKWFKELFMQENVDRNLITMYYEYLSELKIKPSIVVKHYGLKLFFKLNLNEKREFANRVADYFTKGF